jgi:hypothetical protein
VGPVKGFKCFGNGGGGIGRRGGLDGFSVPAMSAFLVVMRSLLRPI